MVEIELQKDEIIKLNLKKKIAELLDGGANKQIFLYLIIYSEQKLPIKRYHPGRII